MSDFLTEKQINERKSLYFYREAKGELPVVDLKVGGVDVTLIRELNIKKSLFELPGVIYPGKTTIDFHSFQKFSEGSQVDLNMYYNGGSIDGQTYFSDYNSPDSVKYNLIITSRTYTPPGISTAEFFTYKCTSDFRGLADEISVNTADNMATVIGKTSLLDSYEGDDYTVQTAGTYKVSKVLSDFADYMSYKKGDAVLEIKGNVLKLLLGGGAVEYVSRKTSKTTVKDVQDLTTKNVSGFMGSDTSFETFDEGSVPSGYQEVRRANGKITAVTGGNLIVYKNPDIYSYGVGQVLEVSNCFVPSSERASFLEWKVKKFDYKITAEMTTSFFSNPLGGKVLVEVVDKGRSTHYPDGLGYEGIITGKTISLGFDSSGKSVINTHKVEVTKTKETLPEYFDWGKDWDTGLVWAA